MIRDCLSEVLRRKNLFLHHDSEILFATSLLRFQQMDALPLAFKGDGEKHYALTGFSFLSKLLDTDPKDYVKLLRAPCDTIALELESISSDEPVESLLDAFQAQSVPENSSMKNLLDIFHEPGFGFAWISTGVSEFGEGVLVCPRDLLSLYEEKVLLTDLEVESVASPRYSMVSNSTIRQVIESMISMKLRRIYISDTNKVVSERSLMRYVFSPSFLGRFATQPESCLEATLDEVQKWVPPKVDRKASLAEAALTLKSQTYECAACENGMLTPWDLIIKPWIMNELRVE